ncbi:MAG: metalloregulator ArsR/SmtB family transcription factor [Spirochaetes bacterium]|jgi:ArsR family transcriptional regulator|nr:metalloregulator ArsR/SmtB family transcription factor [Spirochaetota bacterium]
MNKQSSAIINERQALYEARTKIIKAMAHPTRLFIVEELEKKEKCVNELTEMIGADMSTVSKHLSVLKNAGLIGDRKAGTNIYYYLKTPCILGFLGCVEEVMEFNAAQQTNILRCCKQRDKQPPPM